VSKVSWKFLVFFTLLVFSVWELWPSLNRIVISNGKREEQIEINKYSFSLLSLVIFMTMLFLSFTILTLSERF
jgi:hypothetical protein